MNLFFLSFGWFAIFSVPTKSIHGNTNPVSQQAHIKSYLTKPLHVEILMYLSRINIVISNIKLPISDLHLSALHLVLFPLKIASVDISVPCIRVPKMAEVLKDEEAGRAVVLPYVHLLKIGVEEKEIVLGTFIQK